MDDLAEKVLSYVIFAALVQTLIFRDVGSGHFGFGPPAKNANFLKGTGGVNIFK